MDNGRGGEVRRGGKKEKGEGEDKKKEEVEKKTWDDGLTIATHLENVELVEEGQSRRDWDGASVWVCLTSKCLTPP